MTCICGHEIELHENESGECAGTNKYEGVDEPCKCVVYEEEEGEG